MGESLRAHPEMGEFSCGDSRRQKLYPSSSIMGLMTFSLVVESALVPLANKVGEKS